METPVEIEVKLGCPDVATLAAAHPELGWTIVAPRQREDKFVFERRGPALQRGRSTLRVRTGDGRATPPDRGALPRAPRAARRSGLAREILRGVMSECEAPNGRLTIAQRFSAGLAARSRQSPVGTAEACPRTQPSLRDSVFLASIPSAEAL